MQYRENSSDWVDDLKDIADDFYEVQIAGRVSNLVQRNVAPRISQNLQNLATTKAQKMVDLLVNSTGEEKQLNAIADSISNNINVAINQRVIPLLLKGFEGVQFEKADLGGLYNQIAESVPNFVTFEAVGLDLTLNLRAIFLASFTLEDLELLFDRLKPVALRIKNNVAPVAEKKIKQIAGMCILSGFLLGGLSTFAYFKIKER
tara:strand:+ start:2773 stop:3384 length:612 start_codon:yes stop_codon:yes gene_type:complete